MIWHDITLVLNYSTNKSDKYRGEMVVHSLSGYDKITHSNNVRPEKLVFWYGKKHVYTVLFQIFTLHRFLVSRCWKLRRNIPINKWITDEYPKRKDTSSDSERKYLYYLYRYHVKEVVNPRPGMAAGKCCRWSFFIITCSVVYREFRVASWCYMSVH